MVRSAVLEGILAVGFAFYTAVMFIRRKDLELSEWGWYAIAAILAASFFLK